ncbi:YafY family protein [Microbacterium sp. W4I4]|uniref:helix-turn-helix transcriptional regulator n=1 Tax=Microbacterium sp. W4I4 TaxID=3042295 RepID=UPI0027D84758|nr:YafY family protein [Microbacterium sp. W4I4]
MADTTARALQVLELLQSAQLRTVGELADRLGVDERTIRRDVARLADLGVPVETLRGRYGGYRLALGQRVLPLMFSTEEVIAVFLELAQAQAAASAPGLAAQTALSKITRAMPAADAQRIDVVLAAMTPTSQHGGEAPDPAVMLTLADAVSRTRSVDMRYRSRSGALSRRSIHPYGLVAHAHRWYLVALDVDTREERAFRADRIRTVRVTSESFTPPPRLDVRSRLLELFVDAPYRWQVVLRVRAREDRIREHLPASVARLVKLDDGAVDGAPPWHRAEINAESLEWIPSVIVALGCEVVIDGPDELRVLVEDAAVRMLKAAGARSGRMRAPETVRPVTAPAS